VRLITTTKKNCDLFLNTSETGTNFSHLGTVIFLLTVMVEKTAWQNGLIETGTTLINQGDCSKANTSINRLT